MLSHGSHADRNMAENITVHLDVAIDSIVALRDSLDAGQEKNSERIPLLETPGDTASDFLKHMGVSGNCSGIVRVHCPYKRTTDIYS